MDFNDTLRLRDILDYCSNDIITLQINGGKETLRETFVKEDCMEDGYKLIEDIPEKYLNMPVSCFYTEMIEDMVIELIDYSR